MTKKARYSNDFERNPGRKLQNLVFNVLFLALFTATPAWAWTSKRVAWVPGQLLTTAICAMAAWHILAAARRHGWRR